MVQFDQLQLVCIAGYCLNVSIKFIHCIYLLPKVSLVALCNLINYTIGLVNHYMVILFNVHCLLSSRATMQRSTFYMFCFVYTRSFCQPCELSGQRLAVALADGHFVQNSLINYIQAVVFLPVIIITIVSLP